MNTKRTLFGPTIKARLHKFDPFGEILFSVAHLDAPRTFPKSFSRDRWRMKKAYPLVVGIA